jgi:hypothetical protein
VVEAGLTCLVQRLVAGVAALASLLDAKRPGTDFHGGHDDKTFGPGVMKALQWFKDKLLK